MTKKTLVNIILLAIVIGLMSIVLWDPFKKPPEPTKQISDLQTQNIDRIEIDIAQQDPLVLAKKNNQWYLEHKPELIANEFSVNAILELPSAVSHRQYAVAPADYNKFGLEKPSISVRLNDAIFALGNTDPIDQHRYVLYAGQIHLVTDRFSHILTKPPGYFVSNALLPENKDVVSITLPDFTVENSDKGWFATPPQEKLSQDDLLGFVDEWRFGQALRVLLTDKPAKPAKTVKIQLREQAQPIVFNMLEAQNEVQLQRQDTGVTYIVENDNKDKLFALPKPIQETESLAPPSVKP